VANTGKVQADMLFQALTRPALFLGVSYMYFMLNLTFSMVYFVNTSNFQFILLAFFIHGVGYLIHFKEPLFVELYRAKWSKCNRCRNRRYYGANSYDVF